MSARTALTVCRVLFISAMAAEDAETFDAQLRGERSPAEIEAQQGDRSLRAERLQSWGGVVLLEEA